MATPTRVTSPTNPLDEGSSGGGTSGEAKPSRRTPAQIAKANNSKGKERERRVAKYLQVSGFPGAERTVRTGYRTGKREFRDQGDIDGTPGIVWQIKAVAENKWYQVPQYMADTDKQRDAAGADLGVLVIPRPRHADPATWWAHLWCHDLLRVAGTTSPSASSTAIPAPVHRFLVRLELGHLVPLLRMAGYGTPHPAADLGPDLGLMVGEVPA